MNVYVDSFFPHTGIHSLTHSLTHSLVDYAPSFTCSRSESISCPSAHFDISIVIVVWVPFFSKSALTTSTHLNLGHPRSVGPSTLKINIFFGHLEPSWLYRCLDNLSLSHMIISSMCFIRTFYLRSSGGCRWDNLIPRSNKSWRCHFLLQGTNPFFDRDHVLLLQGSKLWILMGKTFPLLTKDKTGFVNIGNNSWKAF